MIPVSTFQTITIDSEIPFLHCPRALTTDNFLSQKTAMNYGERETWNH